LQCAAVCCCILQCIAVCCSVPLCCSVFQYGATRCNAFRCVAVCRSVLQRAAVCCTVLQCVAVCHRVSQRDEVSELFLVTISSLISSEAGCTTRNIGFLKGRSEDLSILLVLNMETLSTSRYKSSGTVAIFWSNLDLQSLATIQEVECISRKKKSNPLHWHKVIEIFDKTSWQLFLNFSAWKQKQGKKNMYAIKQSLKESDTPKKRKKGTYSCFIYVYFYWHEYNKNTFTFVCMGMYVIMHVLITGPRAPDGHRTQYVLVCI